MNFVNALHIFLVGPLLVLIGALKPSHPLIYYALFLMGVGVMVRFIVKLAKKGFVSSHSLWYVAHILLFATTLMYVGWNGKHTPKTMFSLLMALGITAIAYHTARVIGV
jgi:hypothetical protein